jgi:hypothetical protein
MGSHTNNPFYALQENASRLFNQIEAENSPKMSCRSGCFRCCETEFSIFRGEAQLIFEWFHRLTEPEQEELQKTWARRAKTPGSGKSCAFLCDGACSIYPTRPIICRTQGAPLCINDEIKRTKEVNCCPLNFNAAKEIPRDPKNWFDLNRLTELQSIAEQFLVKNSAFSKEIESISDEEGRVSLKKLSEILQLPARE